MFELTEPNTRRPLAKAVLTRKVRGCVATHITDCSGAEPSAVAIYYLSDPRDIRTVRYVGQTAQPERRFIQHVTTARLWLPDEVPWWVKSPKLRPLYEWIRQLHRDGHRLPVMVVTAWSNSIREARVKEREHICEQMSCGTTLLNFEQEVLGRQLALSHARGSSSP